MADSPEKSSAEKGEKDDAGTAEQDGHEEVLNGSPSKRNKREKSKDKKDASPKRQKSVDKTEAKDAATTSADEANDENENVKSKTKGKEDSAKNGTGSVGMPLISDPRLPSGWMRKVVQRQAGQSAGKFDVYIYSPEGKKFRSRSELQRHFEKTSSSLKSDDFDFTVNGIGNKTAEKKPTKRKIEKEKPQKTKSEPAPKKTKSVAAPKKTKSEPAPKKTKSEPAPKKTKPKAKKASATKQRLVVKLNFSPKKRATESLKESDTSEVESGSKSSKRTQDTAASAKSKTAPAKDKQKSTPKSKTRRRR